jgi:4-amino-4-deoxy-L-arabinose transferase-like glycosyltransferase
MVVSVLMAATLFCFILAVREPPGGRRRALFYGLYASAALATLTKGFIGFLVTGAVMFLWLLVFRQWRRLRPLHLPTGILLFVAIAAPWHLLVARRNPGWAHFYIVYEHFQRYTEPGHGRTGQFWYFVPVVVLGLFPWTGFLWDAVRDALRGGWARREENAEAWFLALWAAFVFLFFSASQSKLIPYILPVFPPLAVLVGRWLARVVPAPDGFERMRLGLRVFGFLSGLLAAALCVMVLKPGLIRDPQAAAALRPYAYIMAGVLALGGIRGLIPRGTGAERGRGAATAQTVTLVFLFGLLSIARPAVQLAVKPGTKELAGLALGVIRPGDQVFHYHNYFQDFPYYAGQTVGLVDYRDELELQFLEPAERQARFIGEAEFRRRWDGPGRVFAVARIRDTAALFADPAFHYHLLGAGPGHYLFSNQP